MSKTSMGTQITWDLAKMQDLSFSNTLPGAVHTADPGPHSK